MQIANSDMMRNLQKDVHREENDYDFRCFGIIGSLFLCTGLRGSRTGSCDEQSLKTSGLYECLHCKTDGNTRGKPTRFGSVRIIAR